MTVISTPNASLKQPVPIDPISNIKSMPGKRQSLSESYRVRSMADLRLTLRHGDPTHRYLRGITAWRRGLLDGLRHSDLAHRCLRGIPAWRRRLLTALRHVHPAHRCLSGILAWQRGTSDRSSARSPYLQAPQSHPRVTKGGLLAGLWHGDHAHKYLSGILAWRRGTSERS